MAFFRRLLFAMAALFFITLSFHEIVFADWREDLSQLLTENDQPKIDELIAKIKSESPSWDEVYNFLKNIKFSVVASKGEFLIRQNKCLDGVERTYLLYVPLKHDHRKPTPLLVYLHGGVNWKREKEEFIEHFKTKGDLNKLAEERGWLILIPFGDRDAAWFDKIGMQNVLTQIRKIKSEFNIDDDRVWMMGISDGGSGSYAFAMLYPTDFTAFAPLIGHMGVANLDNKMPTFAVNLSAAPHYVVNTGKDNLYPAKEMKKTVDASNDAGAQITFKEYKDLGHSTENFIDEELKNIGDFFVNHPRIPLKSSIRWEASEVEYSRYLWFRIDSVTDEKRKSWHSEINPILTDTSVYFGFYDTKFDGEGVKVESLVDEDDCLAKNLGLMPGDIIVKCGDMLITNMDDLSKFKKGLYRGAKVKAVIIRNGEEKTLSGHVPKPTLYYPFAYRNPSAAVKASFADGKIEVEGSRLGEFTVYSHPDMARPNSELIINKNNNLVFNGKVQADIEFMIRNFLANRDRKLIYISEISVESRQD